MLEEWVTPLQLLQELQKIQKKSFCFDGDGALTMHLGSLTTTSKNKNLIHIVFNNGSHESVGGQKTSSNG